MAAEKYSFEALKEKHSGDISKVIDDIIMDNLAEKLWHTAENKDWLKLNIPEIFDLDNCMETPPHHKEESTYTHVIRVVYNTPKDIMLRRSALFHDAGKPACRMVKGEKTVFYGHPEESAKITRNLMKRLGYANEEIEPVVILVKNHMRPRLYGLAGNKPWSNKALLRFLKDLKGLEEKSIQLALADAKNSGGDKEKENEGIKMINELAQRIKAVKERMKIF